MDLTIITKARQFEACLFSRLSDICGIKKSRTIEYNPAANGIVARCNKQFKAAMIKNWTEALRIV